MTQKEFIERAIAVHNNKYNYSKVDFKNTATKVCIICPVHGEFLQVPNSHLRGHNCKKCTDTAKYQKDKFKERFIKRASLKFPELDFNNITWNNVSTPIEVYCHIHGNFTILPSALLHANCKGCPKCNNERKAEERAKEFKLKALEVHGCTYNYDKIEKIFSIKAPVTIECKLHGEFQQYASNHLKGSKCHVCTNIERGYRQRYNRFGTPATLYLAYFEEYNLYKIGVTVDVTKRFNGEPYKPELIFLKRYEHEAQAYYVETQLFRHYYKFLYKGTPVLSRKGNTELLDFDVSETFNSSVETIESCEEFKALCSE